MEGWICIHRKITDNWIWGNKPFSFGQAWIDMLMMANHKDKEIMFEGKMTVVQRGSFHTSIVKLSERFGWERKKTTRFLNLLEMQKSITTKRTAHGTTITIENYGLYQNQGQQIEQQSEQHIGQQMDSTWDTNNNVNNDNNEKNNILCALKPHESELENQLKYDFDKIYAIYPKKVGKTNAFISYKKWVSEKGRNIGGKRYRLTNRQIYFAVKKYVQQQKEAGQDDYQYWKNFDTLMGRQLLDYVEDVE